MCCGRRFAAPLSWPVVGLAWQMGGGFTAVIPPITLPSHIFAGKRPFQSSTPPEAKATG
jgi:hypothetical protein